MKAQNIQGCRKVNLDDPRPLHLRQRPDRQDRMRNLLINFVAKTGKDITARYIFNGANLQVAALDHDYLDVPFTEHAVRRRIQVCCLCFMYIGAISN